MAKYKASVVISSYNAEKRLQLTLPAYNYQTFPNDEFEIIVVDDGSTDKTLDVISTLELDFPYKIVSLSTNEGRASARNHGIKAASGHIIIFSDSDMLPEKNFIRKHVSHHKNTENTFLCGAFWNEVYTESFPGSPQNNLRKLQRMDENYMSFLTSSNEKKLQLLYEKDNLSKYSSQKTFARFYEGLLNKIGTDFNSFMFPWLYFIVMNVSVEKKYLEKVGYFDENFIGWGGEDEELGYRLYHIGLKGVVDVHLCNFHQEHPRSKQKEHLESYQNKLYMIQKHYNLDILLFYIPIKASKLTRSKALVEYEHFRQKGHVNPTLHKELILLFYCTFEKKKVRLSKECSLFINRLKRSSSCPSLCKCLDQVLMQQNKLD